MIDDLRFFVNYGALRTPVETKRNIGANILYVAARILLTVVRIDQYCREVPVIRVQGNNFCGKKGCGSMVSMLSQDKARLLADLSQMSIESTERLKRSRRILALSARTGRQATAELRNMIILAERPLVKPFPKAPSPRGFFEYPYFILDSLSSRC